MKTWEVNIGFKILVGGPEVEPGVDQMRAHVRDMLVKGKLGVRHFKVDERDEQDVFIRDMSGGEE